MATKQKLIARIFLDDGHRDSFQSIYRKVGVSFSFIEEHDDGSHPTFGSDFDLPPMKKGLGKLIITSGATPEEFEAKGIRALHIVDTKMDAREPSFREVEKFYKTARHIEQRVEKLEGDNSSFSDYLKAVFKVTGVEAIWFEHQSESLGLPRFHSHEIESFDKLIEDAVNIVKHW